MALPSDARSDEIMVQTVCCAACGFRGAAVYEESRRGALDSECWEHDGYRMDALDVDAIAALILACPDATRESCDCPGHRLLGAADDRGCWKRLDGFRLGAGFPLRIES